MITLLVPLKKRKISFDELAKIVEMLKSDEGIVLQIACENTNPIQHQITKQKFGVVVDTFVPNTTEEAMIEQCIKKGATQNIVLVRDCAKTLTAQNINAILEKAKQGADIVMLKKAGNQNKIKTFFSNTFKKLCKLCFNFSFYDGDIGIQFFSTNVVEIMQEINPTIATKVKKWIGLKIEYVEMPIKTTIWPKLPKNLVLKLVAYSLLLMATIVWNIFLPTITPLTLGIIIVFVCAYIACGGLLFYAILHLLYYKKIGEINSPSTKILERKTK